MPWEKQFDIDEARSRAMELFWTQGYDATSLQDLLDSMGIQRGSFYDTFKSKHQILVEALQQYDATVRRDGFETLRKGRSPTERLTAFFRNVAANAQDTTGPRGCFLVNCALELAPRDAEVAAIVNRALTETEAFFQSTIEEGQRLREIPSHVNAKQAARSLLGLLLGMRVLARSQHTPSVLDTIAEQALALVK